MTNLVSDNAKLAALVGDGYTTARLDAALSWASSEIRAYCNQDFDEVLNEVVILDPVRYATFLPETPVTAVTKVEMRTVENGVVTDWVEVAANTYLFKPNGHLFSTMPGWSPTTWATLPQCLRVTYSHGYAEIPVALQDLCLRLAVQFVTNPSFRIRHKVGDKEDQYQKSGGSAFTPVDEAILDRYTIVGIS